MEGPRGTEGLLAFQTSAEEGIGVDVHLVQWSIRESLWWEDPGRVGMGIYQILGRFLPVL